MCLQNLWCPWQPGQTASFTILVICCNHLTGLLKLLKSDHNVVWHNHLFEKDLLACEFLLDILVCVQGSQSQLELYDPIYMYFLYFQYIKKSLITLCSVLIIALPNIHMSLEISLLIQVYIMQANTLDLSKVHILSYQVGLVKNSHCLNWYVYDFVTGILLKCEYCLFTLKKENVNTRSWFL